jgi:hypothetical protein
VPKLLSARSQDSVSELNVLKKLRLFHTTAHDVPAVEEAEEYSLFTFNLSSQKN